MPLAVILLIIGIAGFGLAGYLDLKTTEFPDWLPYGMIALILIVRLLFAFAAGLWDSLIQALLTGGLFLALGSALYFAKQWGDGDAWLMAALGLLLGNGADFGFNFGVNFQSVLVFNFFVISLLYLITYSLVLGAITPGFYSRFIRYLNTKKRGIAATTLVLLVAVLSMALYFLNMYSVQLQQLYPFAFIFILLASMNLFFHYGKFMEQRLFRRRIRTSQLREGDVIEDNRWRSTTKAEIRRIQKQKTHVWIKEGIRFSPVFVIVLLVTVFYGSLMSLFLVI